MTTPIHVLCSNFTEIVRQEVGETMRCYKQSVRRMRFFPPFCASLAGAPKVYRGAYHMTLRLPVKFCPNRFRFAGVIPVKVIWCDDSICLLRIIIIDRRVDAH